MRIRRITLHPFRPAFTGGGYRTSYGNRTHLDNLIVAIETEDGLVGHGEIARITGKSPEPGSPDCIARYRPRLDGLVGAEASPAGIAAALGSVQPEDHNLACALDTAAWDLLGKASGMPVHALMGGAQVSAIPIYFTLGQTGPTETAASIKRSRGEGYRVFQIKVGADPAEDRTRIEAALGALGVGETILFDANGGWSVDGARALIRDLDGPNVLWEEPCATYEENRALAECAGGRLVLDQCMGSLGAYARLAVDRFAAGTGLKPTIQKGLTNGRAARDLCIEAGIALKIDDSWGGDICTAASLALAIGVPEALLICGADMRLNFETGCAASGPILSDAMLKPAQAPGLGLDIRI